MWFARSRGCCRRGGGGGAGVDVVGIVSAGAMVVLVCAVCYTGEGPRFYSTAVLYYQVRTTAVA